VRLRTALSHAQGLVASALVCAGCSFGALDTVGSIPASDSRAPWLDGRAYVLRGLIGVVFSTGMDDLASELNSRGIRATSHGDPEWRAIADDAIAYYRAAPDRARILLAGHSDGADAIISISNKLKAAGVPVALAVAFDPTRGVGRVPTNVERFINLYQSRNFLGGGAVSPASGFRGHFSNVNLHEHGEIMHVTIDKSRALRDAILPKFLHAAAFGPPPKGDVMPIDYVVPGDAPIEVWDSGMTVQTGAGDTVESLAARYSVPAWAIRRLNRLDGGSTISPGRRLVVPRNISLPDAIAQELAGPPPESRPTVAAR
jgi:hypothetical protein